MSLIDAGLLSLETSINYALSLDSEISSELGQLHGRVIGFDLQGTGIRLYMVPDQAGRIQLLSHSETQTDCLISGSPVSLMRSHFDENNKLVFSGDIKITGNAGLAQKFVSVLKRLDIDLEEQLSSITGDVIAHQIGENFRRGFKWLSRNNQSALLNIQEYLQEEARLLPTLFELENHYLQVDQIRDDVERLEARINLLKKTMESGE